MTDDEIREYATTLILEHARDVEFLTIHEMAEEHAPGGEISDEDAKKVDDLITKATVEVSWPPRRGHHWEREMSAPKPIIPADYNSDDAAHFAVGYLSSAIKGFLDGHHDVDLLRASFEKLTTALDERDGRRPVPAVSEQEAT